MGHEAEVINYANSTLHETERPALRSFHPARIRHAWRFLIKSRAFRGLGDSLCSEPFTKDPNDVPWTKYEMIVVGSDVVWDFASPHFGQDRVFFGEHPSQSGSSFLSYAASCGPASSEETPPQWVSDGLARFSSLGVRDANTFSLAAKFGTVPPKLVVDPTWLQDDPAPRKPLPVPENYLLLYGDALDDHTAGQIQSYAMRRGLVLLGAASQWKYCDRTINGLDPFQWAKLFADARAVVTCTLHGLLYAIKYEKPFLMVSTPASAQKSSTVVDFIKAGERRIPKGTSFSTGQIDLLSETSDYERLRRESWISESRDFLRDALLV
jgi:hypothetical protein